jgi:hypothetical protein
MAYAWRRMVFFLSLQPEESVQEFVARAFERLEGETRQCGHV